MVPEDVVGRLGAVLDEAGDVHHAALVQVDLRPAHNLRVGLSHRQVDVVRHHRGPAHLALVQTSILHLGIKDILYLRWYNS